MNLCPICPQGFLACRSQISVSICAKQHRNKARLLEIPTWPCLVCEIKGQHLPNSSIFVLWFQGLIPYSNNFKTKSLCLALFSQSSQVQSPVSYLLKITCFSAPLLFAYCQLPMGYSAQPSTFYLMTYYC